MDRQRSEDVLAFEAAESKIRETANLVAMLRPLLDKGVKAKADHSMLLQQTWTATKKDHKELGAFVRDCYSAEAVSLKGMETVADHDLDFVHTLRTPFVFS